MEGTGEFRKYTAVVMTQYILLIIIIIVIIIWLNTHAFMNINTRLFSARYISSLGTPFYVTGTSLITILL